MIEDKRDYCDIKEIINISKESYEGIVNTIIECNKISLSNIEIKERNRNKKILGKLVLNISNKCNLRCRYCYANSGIYKSEEDLMNIEIAKKTLDRFYNHYDGINLVQIFGGEPTKNPNVLKYICDYIMKQNKEGETNTIIGMVTNGTIMNDEIISYIKDYNIQVTISYDGNPIVNDIMRIFPSGGGTSNIILDNIKKLKEITG